MVGMKRGTWTKVRDDLKSYDEDPAGISIRREPLRSRRAMRI